jgi:Peptidase A4 family
VATGASGFRCVEATWVQPKVGCRGSTIQSAVYWVGLGGFDQRSLVQVGTESVCDHGVATASAWHESLPVERFSIRSGLEIAVGDRIWAQVRWVGSFRYRISLSDLTSRRHLTLEVVNKNLKRTSAEWIVESPTGGCPSHCRTLKMPDFGTFRFAEAWTTIGNSRRAIDAERFSHTIESMVSPAGAVRAEVTTTGSTGTSFAVRWRRP